MGRRATPPWLTRELDALARAAATRVLSPATPGPAGRIVRDGRTLLNFSSNDYLGLAQHPALKAAAHEAAERYGTGSGASRLITGDLTIHRELEQRVAAFKGTEDALVFSTGYQANQAILQTLMPEGVIFSDALNHASIVDGCRLARAATVVYGHADTAHLERLLVAHAAAPRKLIVTDGVFSMDGDIAPLPEIVALAEAHDALVVVDDAHATGVLGDGRGSAQHFGLTERVDVHMGTFGKALGSFGAYVATSRDIVALLVNRARSFIFTTAPPAAVSAASMAALGIVEREPERLERLRANAEQVRRGLAAAGFDLLSDDPTPIVPVVLGANETALVWSERLREEGFWVHPIRPPTVPAGTSRLRVTVTSEHTTDDIAALCAALAKLRADEPGR